jgi:hypothetical protein
METKGLKREELEAQEFGLLPDRVEMRRRRRRGIRNTAAALAVVSDSGNSYNVNTNFAAGDDIIFDF